MSSENFESRTEKFVLWLQRNDVQKSPKITIANRSSMGEGRCVMATEDIEEGEVLSKIPRAALLNIKNCSLIKDHESMASALSDLPDWEGLILTLMYEWKVKKDSSPWLEYFDVLPLGDDSYIMNQLNFWQQSELEQLSPSLVLDRIGRDSAAKLYATLKPLFDKYIGEVSKEEFNLVASVIMSYSFDLDNEKEQKEGEEKEEEEEEEEAEDEDEDEDEESSGSPFLKSMVPFADTMNAHSRYQNAYVHEEGEFLVIEATKAIPSNQQVFNTYSVDSNAELLRMYGYVEELPMESDVGEISLESIKQYFAENSSLSKDTIDEIVQILKEVEVEDDEPFVFDSFNCYANGEIDKELTFMIQFFVIISAINHQKSFNSASSAVKSRAIRRVHKKIYQLLMGGKITKHMLDHYLNIVRVRLSKYPKSASMAPWDSKPDNTGLSRAQMAKMVLYSEYTALSACTSTENVFDSAVIDDDKLLRNIMKKDVFEEHVSKKQKLN